MRTNHPSYNLRLPRPAAIFVLTFLGLALFRLVDFQLIHAEEIRQISADNRAVNDTIEARRGSILDSSGEVLAKTVARFDINVDPSMVKDISRIVDGQQVTVTVEQAAGELAKLLKMDASEVLHKIIGTSRYSNVKKAVDGATYRKIKALEIPWVFPKEVSERVYPNGAVAGNLIGFVGSEGEPLAGLERQMNGCLAGVDGQETYEKGVDGIKIPSSVVTTQVARDGSDVILTINADLQYYTQQVLVNTVANLKADWASAVVVEVKTGKILAAAEAPTVDPNSPGKVQAQNRGARIFQAVFEPGSTLKSLTAASAVDSGVATPSTKVKAPYRIRLPWGEYIQDSHMHPTQNLTLTGVLRDSSNTGIIQIGDKVPLAKRFEYLQKFGLGKKTAVNFEGESGGILRNYKEWDKMTAQTSMFGQGLAVTPIQTAFIYQAIANKGLRLEPKLVEGCRDSDGNLNKTPDLPGVQAISPEAAKTTVAMLEKVVEDGPVGRTAAIPGYRVAGKSGTAQIGEGKGYGYRYAISFIGMAPADDPQYVVAVTVYKPRTVSNSIGATPPFKSIFQQVLRTYRVPPSTTKSSYIPSEW